MEGANGKQRPYVMIAPYARPEPNLEQPCNLGNLGFDSQLFNNIRINNNSGKQAGTIGWHLNQIKGPSGSVRGHRDVVKRSLENIKQRHLNGGRNTFAHLSSFVSSGNNQKQQVLKQINEQWANYLSRLMEEEQDQCVAYTTTLGIIRRTFEDSKQMRSILDLNLIRYEERDIYLNEEYKNQLRMRCSLIKVPALFVDGQLVGGIKELELLNESGKLCLLLDKFKMSKASSSVCLCCGNAKFIACPTCNGSRRSAIHHFKFNSIALRCIRCHQNDGLVQCPLCSSTANDRTRGFAPLVFRELPNIGRIQEKKEEEEEEEEVMMKGGKL